MEPSYARVVPAMTRRAGICKSAKSKRSISRRGMCRARSSRKRGSCSTAPTPINESPLRGSTPTMSGSAEGAADDDARSVCRRSAATRRRAAARRRAAVRDRALRGGAVPCLPASRPATDAARRVRRGGTILGGVAATAPGMRRGTKPKPTARRKLEGNPGRRPFNVQEPQLPPLPPIDALPTELLGDAVASAEWARLVPLLRRARAISEGDRSALLALCQQWARYLDANGRVATAGMVIKAPTSGYPMPNPYIAIANKALGNCVKLWAELGLTPSARSRVVTTAGGVGGADDP